MSTVYIQIVLAKKCRDFNKQSNIGCSKNMQHFLISDTFKDPWIWLSNWWGGIHSFWNQSLVKINCRQVSRALKVKTRFKNTQTVLITNPNFLIQQSRLSSTELLLNGAWIIQWHFFPLKSSPVLTTKLSVMTCSTFSRKFLQKKTTKKTPGRHYTEAFNLSVLIFHHYPTNWFNLHTQGTYL